MNKLIIYITLSLLCLGHSHSQASFLFPCSDLERDVVAMKSDIITIKNRQNDTDTVLKNSIEDLNKKIDGIKAELDSLKSASESLTQQKNLFVNEVKEQLEANQRSLDQSKELEAILVKYGNNPYGMSALHYAIKKGDVSAVSSLIANGADANSTHVDFRPETAITALSRAAICNQLEIATILLNSGANVNFAPYEESNYPIFYAAQFGSGELVTLLIQNGGKLDRIRAVKELDGSPLYYVETPLHFAAKTGNYEAVIALIDGGALIDGTPPSPHYGVGGTPLDYAAEHLKYNDDPQNLELVKFLVTHGATRRNIKYHGNEFNWNLCPVISGYLKSVGK